MVTKSTIDRLRTRIEALAPPPAPVPECGGWSAKEEFRRRLNGIAARLRTAREEAAARGELLPPLPTTEEVAARFEAGGYHDIAAALWAAAAKRSGCVSA